MRVTYKNNINEKTKNFITHTLTFPAQETKVKKMGAYFPCRTNNIQSDLLLRWND